MPQKNCQKIKLLKLMEILRQETDEEHPLKTSELCQRLVSLGISCDPRTLSRNIKLLNEYGYEIMSVQYHREKAYYICDRSFSVPELKILIDAVQAANFVTEKKTSTLIEKIAELGGSHKADILKSNIINFNMRKHGNETIYYTVDYLEEAIQNSKQISFRYFDLDETGTRIYRKNGEKYVMEPISLVYNEDNYYLVSFNPKYGATTNYRVDRIDSVEIIDKPISSLAKSLRKNVGRYTEETFKMYNGEPEDITLRFEQKLIGAIFDKFGEGAKTVRIDDHTIEANLSVRIAPTFWGWLFQFGNEMSIVSPETRAKEYVEKARAVIEKYKELI